VNSTQFAPAFIDYTFSADDHDVLLQLIELDYALHQTIHVQRRLGQQHDVRFRLEVQTGDRVIVAETMEFRVESPAR
jgi:hypothetical protein